MIDYAPIELRIVAFASRHAEILTVSRGNNPEESNRAYFLHTREYIFSLEDALTDLDLEMTRELEFYGDLFQWPSDSYQTFFGAIIWQRQ